MWQGLGDDILRSYRHLLSSMSEKTSSLPHFTPLKRNNIGFSIPRWALVLLTLLAVKLYLFYAQLHHRTVDDFTEFKGLCTQSKELIPEKNADIWSGLGKIYSSEKFSGRAVKWLSGAVQIKFVQSQAISSSFSNLIIELNLMITWIPLVWIHVGKRSNHSTSISRVLSPKCESLTRYAMTRNDQK